VAHASPFLPLNEIISKIRSLKFRSIRCSKISLLVLAIGLATSREGKSSSSIDHGQLPSITSVGSIRFFVHFETEPRQILSKLYFHQIRHDLRFAPFDLNESIIQGFQIRQLELRNTILIALSLSLGERSRVRPLTWPEDLYGDLVKGEGRDPSLSILTSFRFLFFPLFFFFFTSNEKKSKTQRTQDSRVERELNRARA